VRCGYRSSRSSAFFRRERDGLLGWVRTFCMGCAPYAATRRQRAAVTNPMVLFAAGAALVALGGEWLRFGHLLLFLGTFHLAHPLTIAVHETGHAAVGRLLGMHVVQVIIGTGPALAGIQIGGIRVKLRRFLLAGGATLAYDPALEPRRWRQGLMLLGGAVANLGVVALGCLWLGPLAVAPSIPGTLFLAQAILLSQLTSGILNLVPWRSMLGRIRVASDGRQLLILLRARDYAARARSRTVCIEALALLQGGRFEAARRLCEEARARHPESVPLLAILIEAISRTEGPKAALHLYLQNEPALQPDEDIPTALPTVLAVAAWSAVQLEDGESLRLADRLSQDALKALPEQAEFQAARGMVLTRLGDDGGRALLLQGIRGMPVSPAKADPVRFLADHERSQGATAAADEWDGLARYLADLRLAGDLALAW
jgi:hypothetical protein